MASTRVKGDAPVTQPAAPQLCACCKAHPVTTGQHPTVDTSRVRSRAHHPDPTIAHVASVSIAYATEVEDWKRLAAAEPDPQRAENFRKNAAVATAVCHELAVVAQDAEAVSQP